MLTSLTVSWLNRNFNTLYYCPSETQEKPGFSLTEAVEDVSQHDYAQIEALKENQKTVSSLQVHLYPLI